MHELVVVKSLNEYDVIGNERACAERIGESLDWHGEIIDAQSLVDVKFRFLNFFRSSSSLTENSQSKLSTIDICDCIEVSL